MRRESSFDSLGRLATLSAARGGVLEGTATFSWSGGRLRSIHDTKRSGPEEFTYDVAGRLAEIRYATGERSVFQSDLRSRRIEERLVRTDGSTLRVLGFEYDLVDRELVMRESGAPLLSRSYLGGTIDMVAYGNGLVRSFGYDPATGFPSGSMTVDASAALVESTTSSQGLDAGHIRVRSDTTTHVGAAGTTTETHYLGPIGGTCCDSNDVFAQGKRVALSGDLFEYDSLSNRESQTGNPAEYNDERNRLLLHADGVTTTSYTYDAAGFVTNRGGVALTWTATGMLATHGTTQLAWDMLGRLISTTVSGQTTRWLWGGRVQADAAGNPVAIELGEVRIGLDGSRLYRHLDFRNNVKFTTNDAGTVVAHYGYGAWGLKNVSGASTDAYRFAGKQEIGDLVIMGRRVYDPRIGRFLSQDPILNLLNQYAYTLGNPIWFGDPAGEASTAFKLAVLSGIFGLGALGGGPAGLVYGAIAIVLGVASAGVAEYGTPESGSGGGGGDSAGGVGGGSGSAGNVGGGGGAGCAAPTKVIELGRIRDAWIPLLVLQALLGAMLLQRMRRRVRTAGA